MRCLMALAVGEHGRLVLRHGGVAICLASLAAHPTDLEVHIAGLAMLRELAVDFAPFLRAPAVVQAGLHALSAFPEDEDATNRALGLLTNLLAGDEEHLTLAGARALQCRAGVPAAAVDALARFSAHTDARTPALMVLSYLAAGDDACVAALGEARAVPAVLRALEEGREAGADEQVITLIADYILIAC